MMNSNFPIPTMGQGRKSVDELIKLWTDTKDLLEKVNADNAQAAAEREMILQAQAAALAHANDIANKVIDLERSFFERFTAEQERLAAVLDQLQVNQTILQGNINILKY